MEISETRVKLTGNTKDRLKAVCSVTIDGAFVVRDIKVIDGATGLFVAMPSRKLADHCPRCRSKNHLRARFCNDCGAKLDENRVDRDRSGRMKLHADIAHPINSECRSKFQSKVVEAFMAEVEKSKQPGYMPVELDEGEEDAPLEHDDLIAELKREAEERHSKRSSDSERYRGAGRQEEPDQFAEPRRSEEPVRSNGPRHSPEPSRAAALDPDDENAGFGAGLV